MFFYEGGIGGVVCWFGTAVAAIGHLLRNGFPA